MIIIVFALIGFLVVAGIASFFYWNWAKKAKVLKALERSGSAAEKLIDDATKGVLPSINTNPLENKPDINPAGAANPIKDIKINPFDI